MEKISIHRQLLTVLIPIFLSAFLSAPAFSFQVKTLYDDFSNLTLSADRWSRIGSQRFIENGKLQVSMSTSSVTSRGRGMEILPRKYEPIDKYYYDMVVKSIKAKAAISDVIFTSKNARRAGIRVGGTMYNTDPDSNSQVEERDFRGDVWCGLYFEERGNGLEAVYRIFESTSTDWSTSDTVAEDVLIAPGSLQMNIEYDMMLEYDGNNGCTFTMNGVSSGVITGPTKGFIDELLVNEFDINGDPIEVIYEDYPHGSAHRHGSVGASIGTKDDGDDFPVEVSGTFDDVMVDDEETEGTDEITITFDDFNSPELDLNRWVGAEPNAADPAEFKRFVEGDQDQYLKMETRSIDNSAQRVRAYFTRSDTDYIETTVSILSESNIPLGSSGRIRLEGYFYNAEFDVGEPRDFLKGNIWAQVVVRKRSWDGALQPFFYIERVVDSFHNVDGVNPADLTDDSEGSGFFQNFNKTFELDTKYIISIELDRDNKTLTGTFDGEQIIFDIPTPLYPVHEENYKGIQTRVDTDAASIVATADNVRIFVDSPFEDAAPVSHQDYVDAVQGAGVSKGCDLTGSIFCAGQLVPRELAAVWLLRAKEGGDYDPPLPVGSTFNDVQASDFAHEFIEELASRGWTEGCNLAGDEYCPKAGLSKLAAAKMLLKAKNGMAYSPPAATGNVFDDVAASDFGAEWIEDLYNQGFTDGCDPTNFCPSATVNMTGFAKMVTKTFGL